MRLLHDADWLKTHECRGSETRRGEGPIDKRGASHADHLEALSRARSSVSLTKLWKIAWRSATFQMADSRRESPSLSRSKRHRRSLSDSDLNFAGVTFRSCGRGTPLTTFWASCGWRTAVQRSSFQMSWETCSTKFSVVHLSRLTFGGSFLLTRHAIGDLELDSLDLDTHEDDEMAGVDDLPLKEVEYGSKMSLDPSHAPAVESDSSPEPAMGDTQGIQGERHSFNQDSSIVRPSEVIPWEPSLVACVSLALVPSRYQKRRVILADLLLYYRPLIRSAYAVRASPLLRLPPTLSAKLARSLEWQGDREKVNKVLGLWRKERCDDVGRHARRTPPAPLTLSVDAPAPSAPTRGRPTGGKRVRPRSYKAPFHSFAIPLHPQQLRDFARLHRMLNAKVRSALEKISKGRTQNSREARRRARDGEDRRQQNSRIPLTPARQA
eukprot:scaffold48_cov311-Pinguiococcus_pyrenoidosus.AAC.192